MARGRLRKLQYKKIPLPSQLVVGLEKRDVVDHKVIKLELGHVRKLCSGFIKCATEFSVKDAIKPPGFGKYCYHCKPHFEVFFDGKSACNKKCKSCGFTATCVDI